LLFVNVVFIANIYINYPELSYIARNNFINDYELYAPYTVFGFNYKHYRYYI